jgi:nitrate/TMAO reductase-like tetraheme cytochrome c subunit
MCCLVACIFRSAIITAGEVDGALYVGAKACVVCHENEHQQWLQSDHYKAMQIAKPNSVLGDFSGVILRYHNIESRFYKEKRHYYIDTVDDSGTVSTFEIKYTFGFNPLQQYLVETKDGHIQALNIAWDSRRKEEGGQRWFHLRQDENISSDHPFFWTRYFQNWNRRCASCHSTNVAKNYDANTHSYKTTWSEINVSCEACHGPASKHIELALAKQLSKFKTGFKVGSSRRLSWEFKAGEDIATPGGEKNADQINMCGSCHALHTQLSEKTVGTNLHDANSLQLLSESAYFSDGQIREEAFVMWSFLQSKMHGKGVICSNCHNSHTGKTLI